MRTHAIVAGCSSDMDAAALECVCCVAADGLTVRRPAHCPLSLLAPPPPCPSSVDDEHKQSSAPAANGASAYSDHQRHLVDVMRECGFDLQTAVQRAQLTRSPMLIMRQTAATPTAAQQQQQRRGRKRVRWRRLSEGAAVTVQCGRQPSLSSQLQAARSRSASRRRRDAAAAHGHAAPLLLLILLAYLFASCCALVVCR